MGNLSIYMTAARKAFLGAPKPGRGALTFALAAFIVTALAAFWNVETDDGIHCGGWLFPNDAMANYADAKQRSDDAQRALEDALLRSGGDLNAPAAAGQLSGDSQVADCRKARSERTPLVIVFGVATGALLVVGILRRYQPRGGSTPTSSSELKPIPRLRRDDN